MIKKLKISIPNWSKIASGFFLLVLLGSYTQIFAIASPYEPGATLDPECAPGEVNCTVNMGGGETTWLTGDGGISYVSGNVGIGTNTPTTKFTLKGSGTEGTNLITNGTFDSDSSGWELGASYAYNSGKITGTYSGSTGYSNVQTNLNIPVESEKSYLVTFTISNLVGGENVTPKLSGITTEQFLSYGNGTHTSLVKSDYTGMVRLTFERYRSAVNTTWSLDDVSMIEINSKSPIEIYDYNNNLIFSLGDNNFSDFFVGKGAGSDVSGLNSKFIGLNSGSGATDSVRSIFMGDYSGYQAIGSEVSYFFGEFAGYQSQYAGESNFIGDYSGYLSESWGANFIGAYSGYMATDAGFSNFLGYEAGYEANNANESNFIGDGAGYGATNAFNSNFIGYGTGEAASNAKESNFLGRNSGYQAANASNSIFIGQQAGYMDIVNNTTNANDFSILIGKDTSTGGFKNSIALGGSAINTASNQFMIGSTTRPIDITRWNGSASTQCTLTTGTGIACTSDENLKTNINDLDNTILEKLLNVRTVTFNWKEGNSDNLNIGFLAQDLEKYFPELVATDKDGYKSVYYANMTPILTEAVRELNLKVENLENENNGWLSNITNWLSDTTNEIGEFVAGILRAKEKLCIGEGSDEVCITKEELLEIKKNAGLYEEPVQEDLIQEEEPTIEEPVPEEKKEPVFEEEKTIDPQIIETPKVEPIITDGKNEIETPAEEVPSEELTNDKTVA